jgi:hypothetical protein
MWRNGSQTPPPPPNIRLGWMCLTSANTLAYYDRAKITAVKGSAVEAPKVCYLPAELVWPRTRALYSASLWDRLGKLCCD